MSNKKTGFIQKNINIPDSFEKDNKRDNIINWGNDNFYPYFLNFLYQNSAIQSGIVNQDISIKQFGGKNGGKEDIPNIGLTNTIESGAEMLDDDENAQIKTLIDYDDLPIGRRCALDGIINCSSSDSSSADIESDDSVDEEQNKNVVLENA